MTFASPLSRLLAITLLAAASLVSVRSIAQAPTGATATVTTEQVRAELLAHAPDGAQPGKTVWVGLQITHQPEWHTYWKNPGDSGLATVLQWTLPPGVTAGDIAWPLPHKIPIGNLANYGYEGTVLLPVPVTIDPSFQPGPLAGDLEVRLRASWLVCKRECIPQDGDFVLKIPTRSSLAGHAAAFDAAHQAQPSDLPASPGNSLTVRANSLQLRMDNLPAALRGKTLEFFPESPEVIETAARWSQAWEGGVWTASIPLSPQRSNAPGVMPVVLALADRGYRAEMQVQGTWPAVAPVPAGPLPLPPVVNAPAGPPLALWAALIGALVGGLILNLMPCVFPVLAIKVLGFARHANDRRAHRISGFSYTAGVVLSFVALGAAMLGLRSAGESLGWGFQLQDPAVVAVLAGLFTLIGLNLAGLFEFRHVLPSSLASMQARHPAADAFLTGVLAVAVASPALPRSWVPRSGWPPPARGRGAGHLCTAGPGAGTAVSAGQPGAWVCPRLATPGPLDGHPAPVHGISDVCHRGVAGLGAWATKRHQWRRRLLALLVALALVVWTLGLAGRTRVLATTLSVLAFAGWPGASRPCGAGGRLNGQQPGRRLAGLGTRPGGADHRRRATGVRRFHRRLVRDLPGEQDRPP
jgi:DsbC/DsbD-like thiol-disulfide interchange protein